MGKEALTDKQKVFLETICKERSLTNQFYFTGGTALSAFYLNHRLSEDLDFFSEKEFEVEIVNVFLKKYKKSLSIYEIDYQSSFNRNIFFIYFKDREILKAEFTYFPFSEIKKKTYFDSLKIDSLLDIAINKVFTLSQKPRTRDFIDVYFIIQEKKWRFTDLLKKARIKFDWHIDPINLGSQLLKVKEISDYPRMIKKIEDKKWQNFFISEAKRLSGEIFK